MGRYQFIQKCCGGLGLRARDILRFADLTREAFEAGHWIDERAERLPDSPTGIEQLLRLNTTEQTIERFGASLVVKADSIDVPVVVLVHVGGDDWVDNSFVADFEDVDRVPDVQYFERSIELIRPLSAYVCEAGNYDSLLDQIPKRRQGDMRPRGIHWIHYLASEATRQLGGVDHCLRTPVYCAKEHCEGVLLQVTSDPLDGAVPSHRDAQRRAMDHLGLLD